LSSEILVENNENFMNSHYNGISILIREKDGYINVGKLCADFSKSSDVRRNYYGFKRGGRFKRLENYWINHINNCQTKVDYEIKGYKRTQGTYIHPDFIHFVAEWLSEEYAFKVMFIMKEINRRAHLKNIDAETNFQEVLADLKSKNDELEKEVNELKSKAESQLQQIQDLTSQNKDLSSENSDLAETIQEKNEALHDNSVRTLEYNCHSMFVHRDPKNQENYKIYVNQVKSVGNYIRYVFPSSFNIKKQVGDTLKERFGHKRYHKGIATFPRSDWPAVRALLKGFDPKAIFVNNGLLSLYVRG
jgi:hypothetical protein